MERNSYIDVLKGIAIILVVLGHCWLTPKDISWFIYRFHMPLFFGISGYLMHDKINIGFKSFFIKKVKQILLPYLIFYWVSFIFSRMCLIHKPNIKEGFKAFVLSNTWLNSVNNWALWYLPLFFIALLVFYFLCEIKNKKIFVLIILILLIIAPKFQLLMRLYSDKMQIPLAIHVLPAAIACMGVGYILKEYGYDGDLNKNIMINSVYCVILGMLGLLLSLKNNEQILHFESWTYLIAAFCIIQFLIWLTKNNYNSVFEYVGKNSIYIYGLHRPLLFLFQQRKVDIMLKNMGINGLVAALIVSTLIILLIVLVRIGLKYSNNKFISVIKSSNI